MTSAPGSAAAAGDIETLLKACKRNGVFAQRYAVILDVQSEIGRIVAEAETRRRPTEYLGRYRQAEEQLRCAVRRFLRLQPQNAAEEAFAARVASDIEGRQHPFENLFPLAQSLR